MIIIMILLHRSLFGFDDKRTVKPGRILLFLSEVGILSQNQHGAITYSCDADFDGIELPVSSVGGQTSRKHVILDSG